MPSSRLTSSLFRQTALWTCLAGVSATGCQDAGPTGNPPPVEETLAQTLFVAHDGTLNSYDLVTGKERPGAVQNIAGPTDLQALADGTVMVNLTTRNEILAVNGRTLLEAARLPSSTQGGTRPVHSYVSPLRNGKSYWLSLNDGAGSVAATSSARLVSLTAGSSYLMPAGEVGLGIGHHKATFSATSERVVISNISDCSNVITIYDYANPAAMTPVRTLSAQDLGWNGSSRATTCDPTYTNGAPVSPHGCATSKVSGRAYCNLTSSGGLVAIDVDATPPGFKVISTGGAGAGYTKAHNSGRYIFSLQDSPREADPVHPGAKCQIGQLVVVDAMTDSVVKELPLLYKGPGCQTSLLGTDEETTEPSHMLLTNDGKTLFITAAGGFMVAAARVRQHLVVDVSDPSNPVQKPSIPVGVSNGYHGDALSGDGKYLLVANQLDGTVTQVDTATLGVVRTLTVQAKPTVLATYGTAEGPGEQTGPIP